MRLYVVLSLDDNSLQIPLKTQHAILEKDMLDKMPAKINYVAHPHITTSC